VLNKSTGHWVLVIATLLILGLAGRQSEADEPPTVDVFTNGIDGQVFRIPSLICTPNGALLAFCESRAGGDQTPTDMVLRRSLDGGKTWQPIQVVVKAAPEAAMDPTAVIDRATRRVVLVYDRWPEMPKGHEAGDGTPHRAPGLGRDSVTTWVTTSSDDGATWSPPVDITAMTKRPEWTETVHGPGLGIQTRSGRLVIPCGQVRSNGDWCDFTICSDDSGKTWQLSDNLVGPGVDEPQVVELADGTLLFNVRSARGKGCRAGATSKDGGKTWSELFDIPELPEPSCQASILRYTWADQQGGKSRILFCNPGTSQGRHTGTVRLSYDEGKTWPVARVVHKDYFGYSCLAVMPDGAIGCLFETAGCSKIAFLRFSLEWLTDGKDGGL
jgi:sialidase-1